MISPHVQRFLCEHLQGQRSADETKEILRLIDDSGTLDAEFDSVLDAVSQKIPGLAIDFDKLLSGDEIECDPLISQGNLALLRLDAIYHQAFQAWTKSGGDLHRFKRVTKAENPTTYSDRTEKHERTDENYPPDAQLLNQVVNITLSGFRIQATITHRRDQLSHPGARKLSPSQPEASARNSASAEPLPETDSDVIDHNESLTSDFDDFTDPTVSKLPLLIRGVNRISLLKGYGELGPLTETSPVGQALPDAENSDVSSSSASSSVTSASPRETNFRNANNVSPAPREEEPVTSEFSEPSAPPRETSYFHHEPAFHKRE